MAQLNRCPHCGSETVFKNETQGTKNGVLAVCANPACAVRTPLVVESVEYSAMDRVAAVWNTAAAEEWPAWVRPAGGHDAYSYGSKVRHNGENWISLVDANVWDPGVSGWSLQEDRP